MHFLIYIPGASVATALAEIGLHDLLPNVVETFLPIGPDQGPGVLCSWPVKGVAPRIVFRPDEQTWTPAARCGDLAEGRYQVGFWTANPPKPEELARPMRQNGAFLTLGDGQDWLVPAAAELPRDAILGADGIWRGTTQERFHDFVLEAQLWRRRFLQLLPGESLSNTEVIDFAVRCLSINYRLTREVVSLLRIFDLSPLGTLATCFRACTSLGDDDGG